MPKKAIKKQATKAEKVDETAYLLSTKANRKALEESIKQLEKDETVALSLEEEH